MSNSLSKIKLHWVAILLSIFFGILVSSPHLLSLYRTSDFRGVYQAFNDEEIYYQARVAGVVSGNWKVSNVYIKEHKDEMFLVPPVAEWIIALTVFVSGFSVPFVMFLNDIIFTIISFLLFYFLLYRILNSKLYSIIYSSVFYTLFAHILGRPVNPQLTNIFLLFGLLLIYKIYNSEDKRKILNVILGINIGVTLFISPYYGSALGLIYFILNVVKPLFEEGILKTINSIKYFLVSFLPFALAYAFLMSKVSKLSDYADSSVRFGLINTHYIGSHTNILIAVLCILLYIVSAKIFSIKERRLLLGFVSSIFILNWQNVVTGQLIQFASHYYVITVIFTFIFVAVVHSSMIRNLTNFPKNRILWSLIIGVLLLSFIFYKQHEEIKALWSSNKNSELSQVLQEKGGVFEWMNQNTPKDSVFYTLGGEYDYLMPVYTHNKVYYNFYATLSIMSNFETENRWLNQQLFNPEVDKEYILENQRNFWCNTYLDEYHFNENRRKIFAAVSFKEYVPSVQFDEKLIDSLYDRYRNKLKSDPVFVISEYEVDYILLSSDYEFFEETVLRLSKIKSVEKVIEINDAYIYKIN